MANYTILLIDYEPRSIRNLRGPLEASGYKVEVASDGIEGIEAFQRLEPDLTLVEAMIPKKHGFEVCQELKKTAHGKRTPILILTAVYKGRKYRNQALHLYGCDDYLEKPISDQTLLTTVRRLLPDRPGSQAASGEGQAEVKIEQEEEERDPAEKGPQVKKAAPAAAIPVPDALREELTEAEIMEHLDAILPDELKDKGAAESTPPGVTVEPPAAGEATVVSGLDMVITLEEPAGGDAPPTEDPTEAGAGRAEQQEKARREPADDAETPKPQIVSFDPKRSRKRRRKKRRKASADSRPEGSPPGAAQGTGASEPLLLEPPGGELAAPEPVATPAAQADPAPSRQPDPARLEAEPAAVPTERRLKMAAWIWAAVAAVVVLGALGLLRMRKPPADAVSPAGPHGAPGGEMNRAPVAPEAEVLTADIQPTDPSGAALTSSEDGGRLEVGAEQPPLGTTVSVPGPSKSQTGNEISSGPKRETPQPTASPGGKEEAESSQRTASPARKPEREPPQPANLASGPEREPIADAPQQVTAARTEPEPAQPAAGAAIVEAVAEPLVEPPPAQPGPTEPEPSPPATWRGKLVDYNAVDTEPQILRRQLPNYTRLARRLRHEGMVELGLLVDENGDVTEVKLVRGIRGSDLNQTAVDAARKWKYTPATKAGHPVKVWKIEKIRFKL